MMRRTLALGLATCAALCGACPGYPHIGARRGPQPEDIDTAGFWQRSFNRLSALRRCSGCIPAERGTDVKSLRAGQQARPADPQFDAPRRYGLWQHSGWQRGLSPSPIQGGGY